MNANVKYPSVKRLFSGHAGGINSVDFISNNENLVTGGDDKAVIVWHLNGDELPFKFSAHKDAVQAVCSSPCGRLIASGSRDKTVRLWVPDTREQSSPLIGHSGLVDSVHFSPDSRLLASASWDSTVKVWDVEKQKLLHSFPHNNKVHLAKFSPDGKLIATGSDKTVKIYECNSKKLVFSLPDMGAEVSSMDFYKNFLAVGRASGSISVWHLQSKKLVTSFGVCCDLSGLVFHRTGNYLISGVRDGTVKIWNMDENLLQFTLHGHTGVVNAVAVSISGNYLASVGNDSNVIVWKANLDNRDTLPQNQCHDVVIPAISGGKTVELSPDDEASCSATTESLPFGAAHGAKYAPTYNDQNSPVSRERSLPFAAVHGASALPPSKDEYVRVPKHEYKELVSQMLNLRRGIEHQKRRMDCMERGEGKHIYFGKRR